MASFVDASVASAWCNQAVFTLAQRHGLTVYDAAYLDLALREGLPIASLDKALINAAGTSGVAVFQP